jgi:hypothetical protein
MHNSIPEDITSLDIERIDFNNKDTLLKLLDTIEQLAQINNQQHEENQALFKNLLIAEHYTSVSHHFHHVAGGKTIS